MGNAKEVLLLKSSGSDGRPTLNSRAQRKVNDNVLYHSPPGLASQHRVLGAFVRDAALSCKWSDDIRKHLPTLRY